MTAIKTLPLFLLFVVGGCQQRLPDRVAATAAGDFYVGQALVGEGNEIAEIHLLIGEKSGPVGQAFANGLANQQPGHPAIIIAVAPDVAVKPSTLLVAQVTIGGMKDAENFFGNVQRAVAKAVVDSVADGVVAAEKADDLAIVVSAFMHPNAEDKDKISAFHYDATKLAMKRALRREPTIDAIKARRDELDRPRDDSDVGRQ